MKKDTAALPLLPYKGKKFDLMAFVRRRKTIILVLGGFLFAMFVPFAIVKGSFFFEVNGKLLIAREIPTLTRQTEENIVNYFHDYSRTQVERIRNTALIAKALQSLPEPIQKRFKTQNMDYEAAAARIKNELIVQNIAGTHLLLLKFSGKSPDGLAELLNAVMNTYLEMLQSEEENKDSRRLTYLQEDCKNIEIEISEIEGEIEKLSLSTKSISFQEQNNVNLSRFMNLQNAYLDAYRIKLFAENEYLETQALADALKKLPNKVLADEMVASDQAIWQVSNWTYQKLQELRATMDGIARDNPDRRYVEQRMEAMQDYERKTREEVRERDDRIINEKRDYELAKKLIEVKHNFLAKEKNAAELKTKMEEAQAEVERTSIQMMRGQELLKNLEYKRSKLFELESRIRNIALESKSPVRVSVESYALKPTSPSGSNLQKLYMLTVFLSFGTVTVVFLAYDFLDNRIRSPKDLANYLGHSPTWPISRYAPSSAGTVNSFPRAMLDSPDHVVGKAIRSLAVRLNKERLNHEAKIVLMSAVDEQSGTTSITINTALAMRYFCARVLVIGGNPMHSDLLEMAGLQSVLSESAEAETIRYFSADAMAEDLTSQEEKALRGEDLAALTVRDPERGIDFLALGGLEWSSALRRRLPELFDSMSEQYDFIFVDSAPILLTDATEVLVTLAHVAVLIAQGDRTLLKDFARTTDLFLKLEIPAMAAVLNWGGVRPVTWFDGVMTKIHWQPLRHILSQLGQMANGS